MLLGGRYSQCRRRNARAVLATPVYFSSMSTFIPYSEQPDQGRIFPCRQCGASLRFAPSVGSLACATCGTKNDRPITDTAAIESAHEELDYQAHIRAQLGHEPEIQPQVVTCPQCGAQTQFESHVVAAVCAFCATALVSESAHREHRIRPRAIVPFTLEAKAAQSVFQKWIDGRWFAPSALKTTVRSARGVRGVYLPCWTFDAATISEYQGQRGVNRQVQEFQRNAKGVMVPVTRTVIDWYPASGVVSVNFDDTLVPASRSIPANLEHVLQHWDVSGMQAYAEDFVAGFTVEAYQVALEPAFGEAKSVFDGAIRSAIHQDIGGNHQRIHHVSTRYERVTFKHILLPVWMCAYQFKGKSWRVVVNGQTGAIAGDRPWSAWKILFALLAVLAVAGIVYLFTQGS